MKNIKRLFSGLSAAILLSVTLSAGVSAAPPEGGFSERNEYGMPLVSCDTVLEQKEWNGKTAPEPDTCYFVDKPISVTKSLTLPESSMIVVENGGKLTVKENAKLYVKGGVVVHSKAALVVKGRVILKSASISVINGKMTIGTKGRVSVYGDVQISRGALLRVKGRAAVHNNGAVLIYGRIVKNSKSAVLPEYTEYGQDESPLYYAEEYSDYLSFPISMHSVTDDCGHEIADEAEKLALLRSFESVLYKYDGEFTDVSWWDLNPEFSLWIKDGSEHGVFAEANHYNCCMLNVTQSKEEIEANDGSFYSAVLGKVDRALFAIVDPESPQYLHRGDPDRAPRV